MPSPFPMDTQLTAIAIAVQNRELIADEVLPRTAPLNKKKFSYTVYPTEQFLSVPDTRVGRKSRVNQVDFGGEPKVDETSDYGLEHVLPADDEINSPAGVDLDGMTTEWLTGLILLDREIRTARMVLDPAKYGSNHEAVTVTDRFDNPDSDPLGFLLEVLDAVLMRPNTMTIGEREWTALRTHPKIVSAVLGNSGTSGAVTREAVANLLELKNILIGRSLFNTAKPGATAKFERCWAGGVSLSYQDPAAAKIAGQIDGANVTFGFTAQTGTRVAGKKEDPDIGLRGARKVRVGETVKELICAPSLGFLLTDVITPA